MIYYDIKRIGEDWLLAVYGGTHPHIGAICTAKWQEGKTKLLHSYQLPHHKEQELAEEIAAIWCSKFHGTVTVTVGIHVTQATKEMIQNLVALTRKQLYNEIRKQKRHN
ncbi:prenylated flavin chaperone LpdD [Evansella halocellulosilytica]|uniref:prenylated flavin chaperone LpdD n=1 Tax=Evansella halocellulosilytica TaxID=2011013 RepID=UPI000BB93678|nr:hypothetical protein [Evansella halocellulosilytica]